MNNVRRRRIRVVIDELRKDVPNIEMARSIIENVQGEEEDVRDNTPESLQEFERYAVCEESCDALEEALDALDDDIETAVVALSRIDGV